VRILLDTNVLVSAFVFRRTCADLLERCLAEHDLFTSRYILAEFKAALVSSLGFSRRGAAARSKLIAECSQIVRPLPVPEGACRDPNDLAVLGTALAGKCHCIVTGDNDLLDLGAYEDIAILSPAKFWAFEANAHRG